MAALEPWASVFSGGLRWEDQDLTRIAKCRLPPPSYLPSHEIYQAAVVWEAHVTNDPKHLLRHA